jgi:uncharacterized protein (DUF305 family)
MSTSRKALAGPSLRPSPPTPGPLDVDFATLMQVHHQTGAAVAQVELDYGKVAELKDAARRIVRDQQAKIKQYQRWLKAHAASPMK